MIREGKIIPEWVHKVSGIFNPELEEDQAWSYFEECERGLTPGQRVRLYWKKYKYSPATEHMKRVAKSIEKNSNPPGAKMRVSATAGELITALESIVIAEAYPDGDIPEVITHDTLGNWLKRKWGSV